MQKKILVVEDDEELVELLRFNLKQAGFAVGTAGDGIAGLKKARSLRPDLVLLDVMLPELDGFTVCETLRRDPVLAAVPILILTAMPSQLARLTGLDAGANEYLTKPFSPKHLLGRVQALHFVFHFVFLFHFVEFGRCYRQSGRQSGGQSGKDKVEKTKWRTKW